MNLTREQRIEWTRLRNKAAAAVLRAVKLGNLANLKKQDIPCSICGRRAQVYHHEDYGRPLDVQPVCIGCNISKGSNLNPPVIRVSQQCPACGSRRMYYLVKSGNLHCVRCGHEWKKETK